MVERRHSYRHLFVLTVATVLLLTGCRSASWSPDGKTLALDVNGKLYLFDVGTGQFQRLAADRFFALNPAYSPDGARLAYYAISLENRKKGSVDLWVRDLKTGEERHLPGSLPVLTEALNRFHLGALKAFKRAAWSPDGRRLAYPVDGDKQTVIKITDCQTGETQTPHLKGKRQRYPAWSPDG